MYTNQAIGNVATYCEIQTVVCFNSILLRDDILLFDSSVSYLQKQLLKIEIEANASMSALFLY